jgi:hypothetical protein
MVPEYRIYPSYPSHSNTPGPYSPNTSHANASLEHAIVSMFLENKA